MCPVPDDEFKLRFQVAKDRTLRCIGIVQVILVILIPVSFLLLGVAGDLSRRHDARWPEVYGDIDINSQFYIAGFIPAAVLFFSIPSLIITSIIKAIIFTCRYGWRAVSDPIEAQRIAIREALYDVTTDNAQAMPNPDDDRLIIVPIRRLRPVQMHLELPAEHEKGQALRET